MSSKQEVLIQKEENNLENLKSHAINLSSNLPPHWKVVCLGDEHIAYTASGGTPNRSIAEYFDGTIRWVKSGELKDNIIYDTEEKITQLGLDNSSAKVFPPGTLLVAMYGATAGMTGILACEASINQAICAIVPKNDLLDSPFLKFFLIKNRTQLLNARSGGAQPNINQRIVRSLNIIQPPLPEQRAIAHTLQIVQNAIQARRRELELERERKAALMQHLFTRGTRNEPTKQSEVGEIPESWESVKLGDVITLQRGYDLPALQRVPGKVPVVSSSGVSGTHEVAKVSGPGVVTGRYGTIGQVFYIERDFWPLNTTLFVSDFKGNDPLFISYFLQTTDLQTLNDKTSVPGINRNHAHAIRVSQPTLDEQREIATILRACDTKISALEKEIARHEELFRALLEELMTGRLSTRHLTESESRSTISGT